MVHRRLLALAEVAQRRADPPAPAYRQGCAPVPDDGLWTAVVEQVRMPRVMLGAIVGAGLGVTGTVLQAMVRSVLADPYLLGVIAGPSTGAAAALTRIGARHLAGRNYGQLSSGEKQRVLIARTLAQPADHLRAADLQFADR